MPRPRQKGDDQFLAKLGENVRSARENAGLTQEQLAEAADIMPRALQKIEAGRSDPQSTTLARIHAALSCSWEQLVPKIKR